MITNLGVLRHIIGGKGGGGGGGGGGGAGADGVEEAIGGG